MGRDGYAVCRTCREVHYLGYGSYSTWFDQASSLEEWDSKAKDNPDAADLWKNLLYRTFLQIHVDHDFFSYSSDWISEREGVLFSSYDGAIFCDIRGFKHFNNEDAPELPERSYNAWRMMLGDVRMLWPKPPAPITPYDQWVIGADFSNERPQKPLTYDSLKEILEILK